MKVAKNFPHNFFTKSLWIISCLLALMVISTKAEIVIITAKQPGLPTLWPCPGFCETSPPGTWSGGTTFHSTGDNAGGSVYAPGSVVGTPQCTVTPNLQNSNGVYSVEVTHISGNASANIIIGLSASGGTLSTNQTDGFQASHGINSWYHICNLTNTSSTPTITFTYLSGDLAALGSRWYVDGFRFTALGPPCVAVPQISGVENPLAPGQTFVNVPNVSKSATNVTVYADTGPATSLVQIGSLAVTNSTNALVSVTALVDGNYISATQWIGGVQSCEFFAGTGQLVSANTVISAPITITCVNGTVILNWSGLHILQSSATGNGGFTNVPGPVLRGPYTNTPGDSVTYFRLKN